jgi:hypothetical protein
MAQDASARPLAEVEADLLAWLACPWGWPTTARDARPHKEGSRTRDAFLGTLHLMCACAAELQLTPAHKSLAWCVRPDHINAVLQRCRLPRRGGSSAAAAAAAPAAAAAAPAAPPDALSAGRMYQFAQTAFKAHTWLRHVDPPLSAHADVREAETILRTAMHQV